MKSPTRIRVLGGAYMYADEAVKFYDDLVSQFSKSLHDSQAEVEALRKDAECIDWMNCQDLSDLFMGIIIDAPHDGEYFVHGDGDRFYGKTLRDALHAAIAKEKA